MLEVMGAFISDERLLRPMVATTTAVWGLAPSAERTGYAALSYAVRHLLGVARPAGGSGMLAAALRSCLEESGGVVRCNNKVASIGTAGTGIEVVMADGTRLAAPVVVSAVCPRQTVERLIDTSAMPALTGLKDRMRSVRQVDGYQSKIDAVIESLPRLRALADAGIHSPFTASIAIAPPIDEIETMASLHREGLIAKRPLMLLNIPSVADPSLLAGGRHVMSLEVLFTPYELRGGWNDTVAGGWLDGLSRLAEPGFRDRVREWRVMTPPRYEADLGLTRGNPPAYGGGPFDVLFARKDPLVRYATPLPGLYLSGAGTFPGGGISGAAGRNAALKVLADTS
jgi:phytoene dehydrogenase-like protein